MAVTYYTKRKKGDMASIYASINFPSIKRFSFPMPLSDINLKDWSKGWIKTGRGKQMNSYLEQDLLDFKFRVENFYKEFIKVKQKAPSQNEIMSFFKSNSNLNDYFNKHQVYSLIPHFKEIVRRRRAGEELHSGKLYEEDTLKNYDSAIARLEDYVAHTKSKMTNIDVLRKEYILGFEIYLTKYHDHMINSCGTKMKNFKAMLEVLYCDDKIQFNPFKKYKIPICREDSVNIALDEQELADFEALDLSFDPKWDLVRDQFLILCWSGLRISDFRTFVDIPKEGDFVTFHNKKTGEEVNIPIFPAVQRILDKYDGKFPDSIHENTMNKVLKEIGKLVPGLNQYIQKQYTKGGKVITELVQRHTILCNHCGRRSLATLLANLGFPYHEIMIITGHKKISSLQIYLKVNRKKVLSNMVEKVTAYLAKNNLNEEAKC